jgi:hypothetical protein
MPSEISWAVRVCDVGNSTDLEKRDSAELTRPCSTSTFPRHGTPPKERFEQYRSGSDQWLGCDNAKR